jgi:hypothetical protein
MVDQTSDFLLKVGGVNRGVRRRLVDRCFHKFSAE